MAKCALCSKETGNDDRPCSSCAEEIERRDKKRSARIRKEMRKRKDKEKRPVK